MTNTLSYKKTIQKTDESIAFVLGKYFTGGLGTVRCLGRVGVPVFWLDSTLKHIGYHSKYCKALICHHPRYNLKEYIEFLLNIGKMLKHRGVLFPIRDIELHIILKFRSKLEKYFYIPMANLDISDKLLNKYLFYKTLEKLDIPHPKTYFLNDISAIEKLSKKISYPCILKPFYSANFVLDFDTKLFIANSSKQIIHLYKKALSKNHEVMIQEIIPGNVRSMHGLNAYYDKNYTPNCVFMYRRIREWPHGFGNGCFIESVKIPELEELVTPLIKKIKYYGIIDAEIKKDPRDNQFKLIEINSRCWMQCSLPARCGVNIPYTAYLDAIGNEFEKPNVIRDNVKWLFMWEDIRSSVKSILKKELSVVEWIRSYSGEKEYSILAIDDPIPFFLSLLPFYQQ